MSRLCLPALTSGVTKDNWYLLLKCSKIEYKVIPSSILNKKICEIFFRDEYNILIIKFLCNKDEY